MLATISPDNISSNETISTLRYAQQARNIVNVAKVNEDPKNRLIRELQAEINRLRNLTIGGLINLCITLGSCNSKKNSNSMSKYLYLLCFNNCIT